MSFEERCDGRHIHLFQRSILTGENTALLCQASETIMTGYPYDIISINRT
jgi:hypothetical protein